MRYGPLIPWRARLALVAMTCIAACQPSDDRAAPEPSTRTAAEATITMNTPTRAELLNATYLGVMDETVTLTDGKWQGEPFEAGGASRPTVGLVKDLYLTGDLTGDGAEEAVTLLWTTSGGSGTFDYIAVVGRDETGAPLNLATAALGDRVNIRSARIDAGRVVIDVVQAGPDDAACCPGQKMRRTFALEDDALNEVSSEDLGRQSIADLAGVEWRLLRFNQNEGLPDDVAVTLVFDGDRIAGKSACNRYTGSVTEGDTPGALTVPMPLAGTRMACPPPIDKIERRYLETLQNVRQYSFLTGNLALTWSIDDQWGTMIFTPHDLPEK